MGSFAKQIPPNNSFDADLRKFVDLAVDVINTDAGERYGYLYSDVLLQPGFMPISRYPRLCYIGINPSSNDNDAVDYAEECDLFMDLAAEGSLDAYERAYKAWLRNVLHWPAAVNALRLLRMAGLNPTDLGWLNICKVRDTSSLAIDGQKAQRDFSWLRRQLSLMGPDVFVVLGTNAARYAFIEAKLRQDLGDARFGVRGQRGSGESLEQIGARLIRWLHRN